MVKTARRKIVPMQLGSINLSKIDDKLIKQKVLAAEPTGKGDLLIIDGFFGRMFRSSEKCVREEIDEFCKQYEEMCRRLDEDPAHEYYEVLSWNDLYSKHPIITAPAQDQWGYTNSDDYRVDLMFQIDYVTEGKWVDLFGEPYLIYYPMDWCTPDPCYMEV